MEALSLPENYHILTKIRAAITANIRPCAMVYHEQPTDKWSILDFQLLEAYQTIEDEKCPQCGQPIWLCRSTNPNVEWTVKEDVCYASRAKEEKEARRHKKPREKIDAKERASWGRIEYATPRVISTAPEGTTLPTRKDFYSERQSS